MRPFTFIFIGNSGSGKGTQAELLKDVLKAKYSENPIFYLETGSHFREFFKEEGYTSELANKIYQTGERQPDFLAVWIWTDILIKNFKGNEHLFVDGTPRSYAEAVLFSMAMKMYGRHAVAIYIDVSRKCSKERLMARGRVDDISIERIEKRLDWFDQDVIPAIKYFEFNPDITLIKVNGEQSIEDVHTEIMQKIHL